MPCQSATDRFLAAAEQPLWAAITTLEGTGPPAEAALLRVIDALKADGYARLKTFTGRSTLAAFLALAAREILIAELPAAFQASPRRTWPRFERYFAAAIRKRVSRRFPRADGSARDDRSSTARNSSTPRSGSIWKATWSIEASPRAAPG